MHTQKDWGGQSAYPIKDRDKRRRGNGWEILVFRVSVFCHFEEEEDGTSVNVLGLSKEK